MAARTLVFFLGFPVLSGAQFYHPEWILIRNFAEDDCGVVNNSFYQPADECAAGLIGTCSGASVSWNQYSDQLTCSTLVQGWAGAESTCAWGADYACEGRAPGVVMQQFSAANCPAASLVSEYWFKLDACTQDDPGVFSKVTSGGGNAIQMYEYFDDTCGGSGDLSGTFTDGVCQNMGGSSMMVQSTVASSTTTAPAGPTTTEAPTPSTSPAPAVTPAPSDASDASGAWHYATVGAASAALLLLPLGRM